MLCHLLAVFPPVYWDLDNCWQRGAFVQERLSLRIPPVHTGWLYARLLLPAPDSVPPSFSLLLLLSLGLFTGKTLTHSLSLKPGTKHGTATGAGSTSPGAQHPWSSPGCPSDRRVCWNIHIFSFQVAPAVRSAGLVFVERFAECRVFRDHPCVFHVWFGCDCRALLYCSSTRCSEKAFIRPAAGITTIISEPAWTSSDACLLSSTRYEYFSWDEAEASWSFCAHWPSHWWQPTCKPPIKQLDPSSSRPLPCCLPGQTPHGRCSLFYSMASAHAGYFQVLQSGTQLFGPQSCTGSAVGFVSFILQQHTHYQLCNSHTDRCSCTLGTRTASTQFKWILVDRFHPSVLAG